MSALPGTEPRILVIRGGALGDFILTLPALRLLRENFPDTRLEILGYKHIIALAEGRFYADATRSIEYGPVAAFFARHATLDPELSEYFAGFQQIVSYLYDPDGIFDANLKRAGARNVLHAFRKLDDSNHAAHQLAQPLEQLALFLEDPAARVHVSQGDRAQAAEFLTAHGVGDRQTLFAIHPGSGSAKKNWPLESWLELHTRLQATHPSARVLVIGGEADASQLEAFASAGPTAPLQARNLPLPQLAAILERCAVFIGHDSGISHLAAAVEAPCVLLFGPTDPDVWRPANLRAKVLRAPEGDLNALTVDEVLRATNEQLAPGPASRPRET